MIVKVNGKVDKVLSEIDSQPTPSELEYENMYETAVGVLENNLDLSSNLKDIMSENINIADKYTYHLLENIGAERVYKGSTYVVENIIQLLGM